MKLVRFGQPGAEKPGLVDQNGQVRDLSKVIPDVDGRMFASGGLSRLRDVDPGTLPLAPAGERLGSCVGNVGNFIAIGLNYADHAAETGAAIPAEPIIFNKAPSCIVGPNDDVIIPRGSQKTDWEVELAIVIGERASYVGANEALDFVAGYCVCNDVSEREYQLERGGTWTKGKGCPTFGPLGPWLVTKDEIPDVQNLGMWLDVNGQRMQNGSTQHHDLQRAEDRLLHLAFHDPGAGRRDHDRHTAGRRHGAEAASVPQGGRRRVSRNRGPRRAAPDLHGIRGRRQDEPQAGSLTPLNALQASA